MIRPLRVAVATELPKSTAIIDAAADGIITINERGMVESFNPAAARIFGYAPHEVIGQNVKMLMPSPDREEHDRSIANYVETGAKKIVGIGREVIGQRKDGATFPMYISASEVRVGDRRLLTGIVRDVSERKQAERRLAAEHAVTRILSSAATLAEAAPTILQAMCESLGWEVGEIWRVDREANILRSVEMWHVASMEVAEFEADTRSRTFSPGVGLPGLVWSSREPLWIADITRDSNFPRAQVTSRVGLHGGVGFPILLGDEVQGVIDFFSHETRQLDTELLGMLAAIGNQIGQFMERKRAEAGLRESEERFRRLAENAADLVYRYRLLPTAGFEYVSPIATAMTGYTPEEYYADFDLVRKLVHPDDRPIVEKILQTGEPPSEIFYVRWIRKDRSELWTSQRNVAVCDPSGKVVAIEGIVRDISERRRLEEEFRQSQKMEAIGRLAGGMAHDFNNLLAVINGYSQLILHRLNQGDPLRRKVEEIEKAGERAASLTHQLLAFSRKQVLQPRVLNLSVLVSNLNKMLGRLIGEDIDLVTVLDPKPGPVKADPGHIEQVLMNLVVNARDAMPQGGKLTIETTNVELDEAYARHHIGARPGPYVMLAVSDTGCGMDAETRSHIFEPFFTTKEPGKGTGLGLSTVYGIVTQSGGHIEVDSKPGQGATFKIYLSRVEEAVETADAVQPLTGPPQGSETVLVVEDEERVRTLVREILQMYGYTVLEARDGGEALLISEGHEGPIHLMVTDVVMPHMSGPESAQRLTALHPDMRVLYLSGYPDNAVMYRRRADTAFLDKPFAPDALLRKVREVLDAPTAYHPGNVLIVDDEQPVRELISHLISRFYPGIEIYEASDGTQANQKVNSLIPALVILDFRLPDVNGLQVCKIIRSDHKLKRTCILGMSGHNIEETKRNFLLAGADDFLAKPFDSQELERKVGRLLPARQPLGDDARNSTPNHPAGH